jgi:hypothetical protein
MSLNAVRPSLVWVGNDVASTQQLSVDGVPITFQSTTYIKVYQLVVATGAISLMTEGIDYSISPSSVAPGAVSPATLTRSAGALPSGTTWAVYRDQPYAQSLDVDLGGDFSSTDIEAAEDRSREIDQEVGNKADRGVKLSVFDDLGTADPVLPPLVDNAGKAIIVSDDEAGFEFGSLADVDLSVGTVTTLSPGANATVEIVDNGDGDFELNFGIPRGATGASGAGTGDLVAANNLNDVANKPTAFANIKQDATTSATGVVELATDAEAAGGTTNDTTRYITTDHLHKARADVASATTTNLGAVASNFVRITGITTITSFGTAAAGVWRDVVFSAGLTLTHNATSLILPTAANITTAAGDTLRARSLGSGNWAVLDYVKATGAPLLVATAAQTHAGASLSSTLPIVPATLWAASVDVASASTTAIGATNSEVLRITGTTTITSFGTIAAGVRKTCRFQGILTLTHNATSLILPGGANITTAADDRFEALSLGSGNWIVLWYQRADGTPVSTAASGKLVTRAYGEYTTNADLTTQMPYDDTIPQNTEGDEVLTVAITLASTSNRVRITVSGFGTASASRICCALFRDSVADALVAWAVSAVSNDTEKAIDHVFEYLPSLSGSHTFKLRVGADTAAGIVRLNGNLSGRAFGGVAAVKMVVEEIVP